MFYKHSDDAGLVISCWWLDGPSELALAHVGHQFTMRLPVVLTVALLSRVTTSHGSAPGTVDQVVAELAEACTAGVKDTVQQEVRGANNQTMHDIRSGQQEIRKGQQEIRSGQREIRNGQQEIRNSHQDLRSEQQEIKTGQADLRSGQEDLSAALRQIQQQLASLHPSPEECPPGWRRHQDSCYFVPPQKWRWIEAHQACASLDRRARVASVHPQSAVFLKSFSKSFPTSQFLWIGLVRLYDADGWAWSDGTPVDFLDWDQGQPNNAGNVEDCVHMGGGTRPAEKVWHDNSCHLSLHVMCQLNLN